MDLSLFLPSFGNAAFTMGAFILALSIIVAIHEYGHYIVGRWTGIHAEVFSLGFGPVLFSRTDKRGTKWQFAALPFGGYVKFLGDANAASVGADETVVEARNTMTGAPLWARALTVVAGPVFNFIFTIAVFAGVMMFEGRTAEPLTYESGRDLPATYVNNLEQGDLIIAVEGRAFEGATNLTDDLPVQATLDYTVERDGREINVTGPYLMPTAATAITPRSAADDAGIRKGDVITAVDGQPVVAFNQLIEAVKTADGDALDLEIWRDGEDVTLTLAPRRVDLPLPEGGFETRWLIGVTGGVFFEEATERLGLWPAVKQATVQLWFVLQSSLSGLWHMVTGAISSCNLSGPVGIAQTSGSMAAQGGVSFVWFIGMLSAAVGMLNLFPIPILDGGHLVFHAYEAVAKRKPSVQAINILMLVGVALIGSLMIFALLNDLVLCP